MNVLTLAGITLASMGVICIWLGSIPEKEKPKVQTFAMWSDADGRVAMSQWLAGALSKEELENLGRPAIYNRLVQSFVVEGRVIPISGGASN